MSQLMKIDHQFQSKIGKRFYGLSIHVVCFMAIMLSIAVLPSLVRAQGYDMSSLKEVPDYSDEGEYDFDKISKVINVVPYNDEQLEFDVRISKEWLNLTERELGEEGWSDNQNFNTKIFTIVSEFIDPTKGIFSSRFEVKALELEYETTARNWFFQYILQSGYNMQALTVVSDSEVETLYVYVNKDRSYIARSRFFINGNRVIMATYTMPDTRWAEERFMQQKVVQSFELKNPVKMKLDVTDTYQYFDVVQFDYPEDWRLATPNVYGLDGMEVRIFQADKNDQGVAGEIFVDIVSVESETTLREEVNEILESVAKRDIKVGNLIGESDDFEYKPHIYYHKVEIYEAVYKNYKTVTHEFWLAILAEENYYYIVTMITPNRNTDFFTWSRNIEAYKILLESFRI